jgi:hypothetical protein
MRCCQFELCKFLGDMIISHITIDLAYAFVVIIPVLEGVQCQGHKYVVCYINHMQPRLISFCQKQAAETNTSQIALKLVSLSENIAFP